MSLKTLLRPARTEPLPEIRPTDDVLSDIDQQLGRIASARDRALALIEWMEQADGGGNP